MQSGKPTFSRVTLTCMSTLRSSSATSNHSILRCAYPGTLVLCFSKSSRTRPQYAAVSSASLSYAVGSSGSPRTISLSFRPRLPDGHHRGSLTPIHWKSSLSSRGSKWQNSSCIPKTKHGTTIGPARPRAFLSEPCARATLRKPVCRTSGSVPSKGVQSAISPAPPGKSATCLPASMAALMSSCVASIASESAVMHPRLGTNLSNGLCATTASPKTSGRLASQGKTSIG
mmetsp:Transcript_59668/g.168121  ORF Transcript_59668/g.168121 Transcript_59668/m.168121 type:complete len:229 (-) Transcript_59668:661-1347(-)